MRNGASSRSLERTNLFAKHENISVQAPDGTPIFIDKTLGRLLPAIWDQGLQTLFSCGGGESTNENYPEPSPDLYGYIFFETETDAFSFMRATEMEFPPSIYPYFLESHGGIPNRIVRFDPRMIAIFETVFSPGLVDNGVHGTKKETLNAY